MHTRALQVGVVALAVLCGCQEDPEPRPLGGTPIPSEEVELTGPHLDLGGAQTDDEEIEPIPAALPAGGVIQPKGFLRDMPDAVCTDDCSCSTVQLHRVIARDFVEWDGWGILSPRRPVFEDSILFEVGDSQTPPEAGDLQIPPREYLDQVCFYFTYPPCLAYYGWEGRPHPCRVVVQIRYPHSRSSSGEFIDTWQLFTVRGIDLLATGRPVYGTTNMVCRAVTLEGERMPPGPGEVIWSVRGRECGAGVPFNIR